MKYCRVRRRDLAHPGYEVNKKAGVCLPSGIYYYELKGKGNRLVKKLMLMK
jgi:hypothetical protein